MQTDDKHPVDTEGMRLIREGTGATIRMIEHLGVDPSTLSLDAAWLIYIFRTQTALYRAGHNDFAVTRMLESLSTDAAHNVRPEFTQVWEDLISERDVN